jgi:Cu+-exporting ATPase
MSASIPSALKNDSVQLPACCQVEGNTPFDLLGEFVSGKDHTWLKLGASIFLAGQSMVWGLAANLSDIVAFSSVYWFIHGALALASIGVVVLNGATLFQEAFASLARGRLGIESLFVISLAGAFSGSTYATLTGSGDIYYEVVIVVMVIYSFGRKIGKITKSRALEQARNYRKQFDQANRINPDGQIESLSVDCVTEGDRLIVYPGQPITMDGIITSGQGYVKETPLTGEPHPVVKTVGDQVRAGTFSVDATLHYEPTTIGKSRLIDQILQGVEASVANGRSMREQQAARWIEYFVLFVVTSALLTGLAWGTLVSVQTGILQSMSVLLIACPCALGIATPVGIWSGLWRITSMGLSSRSAHLMDVLAHTKHVFFDKTGTLTLSSLQIKSVTVLPASPWDRETILSIARELESGIDHPIARAFTEDSQDMREKALSLSIEDSRWVQGRGIVGQLEWESKTASLQFGTAEWILGSHGMNAGPTPGKRLLMALNQQPIAEFRLVESIREGVEHVFTSLRRHGVQLTILTGDPQPAWNELSGVRIVPGLSPSEKARIVQASSERGETPLFVGDGINDLDAMHASAASISLHDGGALLTQSDSDAILTGTTLEPIPEAMKVARQIDKILQSNLKIAAGYNLTGIALAASGLLHPVASALIMIVSSLTVTYRAIGWTRFR